MVQRTAVQPSSLQLCCLTPLLSRTRRINFSWIYYFNHFLSTYYPELSTSGTGGVQVLIELRDKNKTLENEVLSGRKRRKSLATRIKGM